MQKSKKILLTNWGNYPRAECYVYRPEKSKTITEIYQNHSKSLISRGTGKSYGDSSLNKDGVISTERLNKFVDFDDVRGIIICQPGATLEEILNVSVLKGWFLPVIPGTKYASIGGCVAANVHGKNHYNSGDIGEHIISLKLKLPGGEVIECSKDRDSEIFLATIGGMGMTGFIEEISLKLKPIETISLGTETCRADNIEEMIELFRKETTSSDYMIGWIDHFGAGKNLGRGIFEKASHIKLPEGKPLGNYINNKSLISIPKFFPSFLLNKYSMVFYNKLRFFGVTKNYRKKIKDFSGFFHPLDGIRNWNNLYGKKGLLQYQFLVPDNSESVENIRKILSMIQENGFFSFLAVIKYHRDGIGMVSFSKKGFSIALDFIVEDKIFSLLNNVDDFLAKIGGRVYLAKDARLTRDSFEKMYFSDLLKWKRVLKKVDPEGKLSSEMAKRLGFKE